MYGELISKATGVEDPGTLESIEEIMRCERPTLDGLRPRAFARLAIEASRALGELEDES